MPPTNALRSDTRLTNVSIGYKNEGYIADDVCPRLLVDKDSGKMLEADLGSLTANTDGDDRIGQDALPGLIKYELTSRTYSTTEHAIGIKVHDNELDIDASEAVQFGIKAAKVETVTEKLLLNREVRVAALFAAIANTAAVGTSWDDDASEPVLDVTAGHLAIKGALGRPANSAIVPWVPMQHLRNNASLKAFFSGGATVDKLGLLTTDALKAILNVQNIYVPSAGVVKMGNMPAGAVAIDTPVDEIWGNDVILFYKAPVIGRGMLTTALTYVWRNAFRGAQLNAMGQYVTETYDQRARSTIIDVRTYLDEQMLIPGAAYRLSGILTPASS